MLSAADNLEKSTVVCCRWTVLVDTCLTIYVNRNFTVRRGGDREMAMATGEPGRDDRN